MIDITIKIGWLLLVLWMAESFLFLLSYRKHTPAKGVPEESSSTFL